MNNDNQAQQPGNIPADWLVGDISSPPPPESRPSRKKLYLISSVIIVFLAVVIAIVVAQFSQNAPNCLSRGDFSALTGYSASEPFSPVDDFYSDYILFKSESSSEYDNSEEGIHGDQLVQRIADFYKSHSTKPMIITLTSDYFSAEAELLTNQRIATVQSNLLSSGISKNVINVNDATLSGDDDETEGNYFEGVYIVITAQSTCK